MRLEAPALRWFRNGKDRKLDGSAKDRSPRRDAFRSRLDPDEHASNVVARPGTRLSKRSRTKGSRFPTFPSAQELVFKTRTHDPPSKSNETKRSSSSYEEASPMHASSSSSSRSKTDDDGEREREKETSERLRSKPTAVGSRGASCYFTCLPSETFSEETRVRFRCVRALRLRNRGFVGSGDSHARADGSQRSRLWR